MKLNQQLWSQKVLVERLQQQLSLQAAQGQHECLCLEAKMSKQMLQSEADEIEKVKQKKINENLVFAIAQNQQEIEEHKRRHERSEQQRQEPQDLIDAQFAQQQSAQAQQQSTPEMLTMLPPPPITASDTAPAMVLLRGARITIAAVWLVASLLCVFIRLLISQWDYAAVTQFLLDTLLQKCVLIPLLMGAVFAHAWRWGPRDLISD